MLSLWNTRGVFVDCRDNSKDCECEKVDRLEGSNLAVRDFEWIKAVVFDNVVYYALDKEADHPCSSCVVVPSYM